MLFDRIDEIGIDMTYFENIDSSLIKEFYYNQNYYFLQYDLGEVDSGNQNTLKEFLNVGSALCDRM